jgi:hypothetical protein
MTGIDRKELLSLEAYAKVRKEFRARVLTHKKPRTVTLGEHLTLVFEDELSMRYQVQEMLRIERIFEEPGVEDELAVYGALVPDGGNFKATLMIEYDDPEARRQALRELRGVENLVWVQAAGCGRVFAIADEDLERENADKTSAVHFLRFELDPDTRGTLLAGGALAVGVDHPACRTAIDPVPEHTRRALVADLKPLVVAE